MTKTEIIADHEGEMTETDTMTEGMDREEIGATKVTRGEEERGVAIDGTMMAPNIGGRDRDEMGTETEGQGRRRERGPGGGDGDRDTDRDGRTPSR